MGENEQRQSRSQFSGTTRTSLLVALPAFFVVLILCGSVASAGATPAGLSTHGVSKATSLYVETDGCAAAEAPVPTMHVATGAGTLSAKASAETCPSVSGGPIVYSRGSVQTAVGITKFMKLTAAEYSLTVNYSISAKVLGLASGNNSLCPSHTSRYAYKDRVGTNFSWVWVNDTYKICFAEATWSAGVLVNYCTFSASGTGCGGMATYVATNTTGNYLYDYTQTINYSNPSAVGRANSTSSGTTNDNYGATNSTVIRTTGSVVFSVNWKAGTKLDLSPMVVFSVYTQIDKESHAHARAAIIGSGLGYGVDITGFVLS